MLNDHIKCDNVIALAHYHPENINHKLIFPVLGLQVYTVDEYGVPGIEWNNFAHFGNLQMRLRRRTPFTLTMNTGFVLCINAN